MTDLATMHGSLGIAEWEALDLDEGHAWELVEGNVVMSPKPMPFHNRAGNNLWLLLKSAVADRWEAMTGTEIAIDSRTPATVRAPDVMLVEPSAYRQNPARFTPGDVGLVVEVVSPGSRRTDFVAKRYDYEQAGIPYYWIIDLDQHRAVCLELQNGAYVELTTGTGAAVTLPAPTTITFDWEQLIS